MNMLTLFALFAVTAMLVTYGLENRGPWFILAFAVACARLCLCFSARRLALRSGRGHLVCRSPAPLASGKTNEMK